MFVSLFIINFLLLLVFVFVYRKFTSLFIPLFFAFYYSIFFLLRPFALVYFDLGLDPSLTSTSLSVKYQLSGIIFLSVMILTGFLFRGHTKPHYAWPFVFSEVGKSGYVFAFLLFFIVSYIANVIRFKNALFFLSSGDLFGAAMDLAGGSWFINVLAGMIGIAAQAWLSSVYYRVKIWISTSCLLLTIAVMIIFGKDSARTNFLVILLAWLISYPNLIKKDIRTIIRLGIAGYLCITFMFVYGRIRTGNSTSGFEGGVYGQLLGAFNETRPADNALLVFDHFNSHNYMHFKYLAGAITPACIIPSKLVPFRPSSNKDEQLTNTIFPNGVDLLYYHEGSTLTFTVPASGYADWGWVGVIVCSFIYALIYRFYSHLAIAHPSTKFLSNFLLLNLVAALRLSVETCLIGLYTSILLFGIYKGLSRVRFSFSL